MKSKLYSIGCFLLIFLVLFHGKEGSEALLKAGILFQNRIFPSLFPFLVLSPFFIQYGLFDFLKEVFGPIASKFFHISKNGCYLFFMSMLSGFPSSANYAKDLLDKNLLEKEEAFHILLFSHFSNPLFILAMVPTHPLLVLGCHYISNFFIGFCIRKPLLEGEKKETVIEKDPFFTIFSTAIHHTMESLLFILGVISFFFLIGSFFNHPLTSLFLEVSQGLNYLKTLSLTPKQSAILSAFLLSFGGFSVHLQTYGILSQYHFPYRPYLRMRIFHAFLSSLLVFLLF